MKIPFFSRSNKTDNRSSGPVFHRSVEEALRPRLTLLLQGIAQELNEPLGLAVVDLSTGQVAAALPGSLEPGRATPHLVEALRQHQRARVAQGLDEEQFDEVLISLTTQWQLLTPLRGGHYLMYLLVDARATNLAIARTVLRAGAAAFERTAA